MARVQTDLNDWTLADGTKRTWAENDGRGKPPYLGPEAVYTTGRWRSNDPESSFYLLRSTVRSDGEQPIQLRCSKPSIPAAFLNGTDAFAPDAVLGAGENTLLLVYRAETKAFQPEHAGCMVRLTDPSTGERLTGVRYEPR